MILGISIEDKRNPSGFLELSADRKGGVEADWEIRPTGGDNRRLRKRSDLSDRREGESERRKNKKNSVVE